MGWPVVIADSGGVPVREAAHGYGVPVSVASNGFGTAVTLSETGGVAVVGLTPGDPVTLFAANPALNLDDTNTGTTFFVVVTLNSENPLDQLRVTLAPGSTNTLTALGVGFAEFIDEATALGALTEATFSEASGFASTTEEQVSDWIDISGLGLSSGDQIAIGFTTGGAGEATTRYNDAAYVADTYFKAGTSWNDPNATLSGYTKLTGRNYAIAKIETRSLFGGGGTPPAENTIPMSFDDAMFSAMTEYAAPTTLASSVNLSRLSIQEQSGNPTIICQGDNTVSYCRVDSREALRLTSTATITKCYLEATGLTEFDDHADTVQVYSPGQVGGDLTIQNSHLVAHLTAATANIFLSDEWDGSVSFQDVIVQGGPYGMRIDASPDCHLDISLTNVYFVGPFGTAPALIQDFGTGTHKIVAWDNVCEATIENGVIVPGSAIAAPAFTPRQLDPVLWLEPARGGLFQSNAGTTAATVNGDAVGYIHDLSGNGNHYTSVADDTTRPTLQGAGTLPCLRFDGVNDVLHRTSSLGLYAAGAYTLAFALKGNSPAKDARVFAEGNTATNNTLFIPLQTDAATATSSALMYRNDAGLQQTGSLTNANAFNGSNHVLVLTDDGTTIRSYLDGVAGPTLNYTRGTYTLNRSAIGALVRAATSNWWAGDIYGMVAIPRVVTDLERASLTTYMGNLAGLSL